MLRKPHQKHAVVAGVLVLLLALDTISALEDLPLLIIALGLALLATDRLRVWLRSKQRASLAMLPFMAAALVLMLAFCRGRDFSQGILLLVTIGVVFDILLAALALIGEASKRGAKGLLEFLGLVGAGLVVGVALSFLFVVKLGPLGGLSRAAP
jgi:hypothetical protein